MTRVLRSSVVLSLLSLLVSVVSFVNQLVIAHRFGAGEALDLYLRAISLPFLFTGSFSGVFAYGMVPAIVRANRETGGEGVERHFFAGFLGLGAAVALLGWATAPLTLRLFSGGVPIVSAEGLAIARYGWAATGCSIVLGFLAAHLNTRDRFFAPVVATSLPYLMMIALALALGRSYGTVTLAWGLLAGNALALLTLALSSGGRLAWSGNDPAAWTQVRRFFASVPTAFAASLVFTSYTVIDAYWAPRLGEANLSYLGYCQRLLTGLGAVIAVGPATVLQPRLSKAVAEDRHSDYLRDLGAALRLTLAVCIPVTVGVSLLSPQTVGVIFQRGAFSAADTIGVARILPWMLAGSVPMVCVVLLFKALFARHDLKGALALGVLGSGLYFALSGGLSARFGLTGIGAAYLTSWSVVLIVGLWRVWNGSGGWAAVFGETRFLARLTAGVAAVVGITIAGRALALPPGPVETVQWAVRLALVGGVAAAAYLAIVVRLAPIPEMRQLTSALLPASSRR